MNALAPNGDTPLHVAMRLSDEKQCLIITKLLVEAGCSPCELDADDKPPIHAAVARGFVSVVEYLLSRDVPLPTRILFVALQATVMKRVEIIRLLVSKGANVHVLNTNGDALLHITMRSLDRSVCLEIAGILIDAGCNPSLPNLRGETPLHIAAKQGSYEIVNYLMLFSSSSDISSLLQDDPAVQVPTFRPLIGNTPQLFTDGKGKCLGWEELFADAAGDLVRNSGGGTLYDIAMRQGFEKALKHLDSQAVALPSGILFTALRHQLWMIPSLICRAVDVDVQDEDGDTFLHVAISILEETQCRTTTQFLVDAGCNPFMLNNANKQPIHIAISRGFETVVEYLLSHALHADVSLPPDLLFTALQCRKKHSMIQLLVDHVSDISPNLNGDHVFYDVLKRLAGEYECLQTTQTYGK